MRFAVLGLAAVVALGSNGAVHAAPKYKALKAAGFKTSAWTRNKAGSRGWVVSKGGERYFCRLRGGIRGGGTLAQIKGGRPPAARVGRCSRLR